MPFQQVKLPVSSYPNSWYETHCAECGLSEGEMNEPITCPYDGKKLCSGSCWGNHIAFYHQETSTD